MNFQNSQAHTSARSRRRNPEIFAPGIVSTGSGRIELGLFARRRRVLFLRAQHHERRFDLPDENGERGLVGTASAAVRLTLRRHRREHFPRRRRAPVLLPEAAAGKPGAQGGQRLLAGAPEGGIVGRPGPPGRRYPLRQPRLLPGDDPQGIDLLLEPARGARHEQHLQVGKGQTAPTPRRSSSETRSTPSTGNSIPTSRPTRTCSSSPPTGRGARA